MIRAAGIMFTTTDGLALFLKRGPGSSWPGHWCFPGGTTEGNETAEETAVRETIEELGFMPSYLPNGGRTKHSVTVMPTEALADGAPLVPGAQPPEMVEYTTFRQGVADTFEPHLNGEHTGFAWSKIDEPPLPLHPGCSVALQKIKWNELDVARAVRDGQLASPQLYENMWLFALRITGTGTAYRRKDDEFVLRKPEIYLTDEFLARCAGLPVIVQHPEGSQLDSREYADRVIGSIMLPYIKGNEVWGVARIYDAEAAEMMTQHQLSTSPAVLLRKSKNLKVDLDDGRVILIEGDPHLLDHVAICPVGVWDKGEDPSGVLVEAKGDAQMPTEAEMEAEKKKKADGQIDLATEGGGGGGAGEHLDMMLRGLHSKLDDCMKRMDSVSTRMDSMDEERKKADAAEEEERKKADRAKKDAGEETEEEKKKADAEEKEKEEAKKKADAEEEEKKKADAMKKADADDSVRKAIADLQARMPKAVTADDYNAMADFQARADAVFQQHGMRAPGPLDMETPIVYRRRLDTMLKKHSKRWKDIDLVAIPDTALDNIEVEIFADANSAANDPSLVPEGRLVPRTRTLAGGHTETTFVGHPSAWMNSFAAQRRCVTSINPKGKGV